MTKIKKFYNMFNTDEEINKFMEDKNVIDIKLSGEKLNVITMVIYKE